MTIIQARVTRKANQQSAIQTLEKHFSRDAIGHLCGYKDRQVVDKVMQGVQAMNGDAELILIRAASELGNDDPANTYSADDKLNVRVYVKANGQLDDDLANVMEGSGMARAAYRNGDPMAMASYINTAFSGVQGLLAERELMRQGKGQRACSDMFSRNGR